jgi:hypothetical protein
MKSVVHAVLALSIAFAHPAIATNKPRPAQSTAPTAAHVKAVQDLLSVMQVENVMRRVAYRSRFPTEAQRKAAFAKLDKTPPAEIHRRLALPMAMVISADTALEMTRFYTTPYGKQVIYRKYNSGPQIVMPGAQAAVPKEEKKERKRAAYVLASKELADAEATLEHEAFKLLQKLHSEKR